MNDAPFRITADTLCLPSCSPEHREELLTDVLRDVSRSFYLTVRVLPSAIRPQIGLAYLLARAADTIADTKVIPRERRLAKLLLLRKQLEQVIAPAEVAEIQHGLALLQTLPGEKILLDKLAYCFAIYSAFPPGDQALIAEVVITLTRGMEFDLTRFPGETGEQLAALDQPEELDRYTYLVAGCVGPFWTNMCAAHLAGLESWNTAERREQGIRFGKGLQLCNVLRDIPRDLRNGRCYLPASELAAAGLQPADLLGRDDGGDAQTPSAQPPSSISEKFHPLYDRYLDLALSHLDAGWQYTMSIPATLPRVRLACAWPILIGLKTIAKLRGNDGVLNPDRRIKIARGEVYGILTRTWFLKRSEDRLNQYHQQLVQAAK